VACRGSVPGRFVSTPVVAFYIYTIHPVCIKTILAILTIRVIRVGAFRCDMAEYRPISVTKQTKEDFKSLRRQLEAEFDEDMTENDVVAFLMNQYRSNDTEE
jgi:hypothetical protein